MARVCVNVLVGVPASGKTTFCQRIEALPNRTFNVVHVCYDAYIEIDRKFKDFCTEAGLYKTRRQALFDGVAAIICAIKENNMAKLQGLIFSWKDEFEAPLQVSTCSVPSEDYLFLIDDNNYYRSMRWDWVKLAKKLELGFFETYFDISLQLALERNGNRKHPVSSDTICRMWTRIEKPCKALFGWEQDSLYILGHYKEVDVLRKVDHCLANPMKNVDSSPPATIPLEQSKVHKLDILLRKAISVHMLLVKDCIAKEELKSYVDALQERKRMILKQLRHCEHNVSDEVLSTLVEELF